MSTPLSKRGAMGRSDGKSNGGWLTLLKGPLAAVWGTDEVRTEERRPL